MLTKSKLPLLIALISCLEAAIYLWAVWTTEAEFVFDKCARNSGRASSLINLAILLMIGFFGFGRIYSDEMKKDAFRILITLFAVNHLVHFFYVFQNFRHHAMVLSLAENMHGLITFMLILAVPAVLWRYNTLNAAFYLLITAHLFNVSYFIMKTFYSKVQPGKPAYHNQLGILVTGIALIYVLYGILRDYRINSNREREDDVGAA